MSRVLSNTGVIGAHFSYCGRLKLAPASPSLSAAGELADVCPKESLEDIEILCERRIVFDAGESSGMLSNSIHLTVYRRDAIIRYVYI
jgi:hypothetical protein